jgi:hypothetical protein
VFSFQPKAIFGARIEEAIKSNPKNFFGYVNLKKKRVGYPLVMHFEGRLASPRKYVICLRNLYNEHIPMMSGCLLILAQNTCRMTHLLARFSLLQMRLKAFLLINRSLATSVFPNRWKDSYVTPIFKKGRRNNIEDYHGVAILSMQIRSVLNFAGFLKSFYMYSIICRYVYLYIYLFIYIYVTCSRLEQNLSKISKI